MDVIFQMVCQTYARRLCEYAIDDHFKLFAKGNGFGEKVIELESYVDNSTPSLVLFKNCIASPHEFISLIESTFLQRYVVRVYWCKHTTSDRRSMINQVSEMIDSLKNSKFDRTFRSNQNSQNNQTNRGQHKHSGLISIPAESANASPNSANYKNSPEILKSSDFSFSLRLQTYPRDLAQWIVGELSTVDLQLQNFSHVLNVVEVGGSVYYDLTPASCAWFLPRDRSGLSLGFSSKAVCKLEEILYVCGFRLCPDMLGIDVGASPGAWSEFLSSKIKKVLAIDPANIDLSKMNKNIYHIKKRVEDAVDEIVDFHKIEKSMLLVCDMNKHPNQACKLIFPLFDFLSPGALIILTLKFRGRGSGSKAAQFEELNSFFGSNLRNTRCVWLMANSVYERTFIGYTT